MSAVEKYDARATRVNSLVCVGLDSDVAGSQFEFNKRVIEATHEYTSAYKPNIAFYESREETGMRELKLTLDYLRKSHPDILTICDAKRADIGNTSAQCAKTIFEQLGFDAVTLNPYLGRDALQPFLDYKDKACIIVCRTSNPGARDFQDLPIESAGAAASAPSAPWAIARQSPMGFDPTALPELRSGGRPRLLWEVIAEKVVREWNANGNCMLVAGATYPQELKTIRHIVGDMTLLVPGVGAQGGDVKAAVQAGLNEEGGGLIVNAGRSIIFAEDPGQAARALRDEINLLRL